MGKISHSEDMDKLENRLKTIFRTSVGAIVVNVALGIFKAIVGVLSGSIAITMDAINNFTDAGSSLITILSSIFAAKEPNKKHPFGYGRTEYLGTFLIAIIILYAGATSFIESVKGILKPEPAEYATVSLIIIIVAVVVKSFLSLVLVRAGKKTKSDSLIAAGKESIGDIAISVATIVAAFLYIWANISIEAWLGAVIALVIVKTGLEILIDTIGKILGQGGDAALVRDIKKAIAEHEKVVGAYDLVLHNYGPDMHLASIHLEVEDTVSVSEFDELSREIQNDILNRFGVYMAAIGVYSVNTKDADVIAVREDVKAIALETEYVKQLHGFYLDEDKKDMRFDLVISFDAKNRREVHAAVVEKIKAKYPDYTVNAGMDTDYNEI